jgi:hypothetical protein
VSQRTNEASALLDAARRQLLLIEAQLATLKLEKERGGERHQDEKHAVLAEAARQAEAYRAKAEAAVSEARARHALQDTELALLRARELTSVAEAVASADAAETEAGKLRESNKHLREQLEVLAAEGAGGREREQPQQLQLMLLSLEEVAAGLQDAVSSALRSDGRGAVRCSHYLLYWYKSRITDSDSAPRDGAPRS